MDISNVFAGIGVAVIFLGMWIIPAYKENKYRRDLYKKVGWIAEKEKTTVAYGGNVSLRSEDLIYYIMQQQIELDIPKQYCIDFSNISEKKNVEVILNCHKNKVVESYFHDFLSKSRKVCQLKSLEYYFFSLYCFFYNEHKDESNFRWSLNDYGRAYCKLYLITTMFVESNEKIKNLFEYINPNLKKITMEHLEKINLHLEERKKYYGTYNI